MTKEKKLDKALEMTFPASDPPVTGKPTSTEPPGRPADRRAPVITREDIEQAQEGSRRAV